MPDIKFISLCFVLVLFLAACVALNKYGKGKDVVTPWLMAFIFTAIVASYR